MCRKYLESEEKKCNVLIIKNEYKYIYYKIHVQYRYTYCICRIYYNSVNKTYWCHLLLTVHIYNASFHKKNKET